MVAIWVIYTNGHVPVYSSTPIWLLLFGGLGISVGLCVLGRKVIETVGNDLAVIIPSRYARPSALSIDRTQVNFRLSAVSVSVWALPVPSSCVQKWDFRSAPPTVLSAVLSPLDIYAGLLLPRDFQSTSVTWPICSSRAVNWKVFGNIMGCALFTVPFAGACSAGAMALLGLLPWFNLFFCTQATLKIALGPGRKDATH